MLTVGAEKITKSQFEQIMSTLPEQQRAQLATPDGRRQLGEQVAELKALAQEARVRKIDQTPETKAAVALRTDQLLATLLYQSMGDNAKPDDAALHTYYDAHKAQWEEVKARHILIRFQGSQVPLRPNEKDLTDAEALAKTKDLRAKIAAGADFAEVAKTESDDTGSGANGGDLGSFPKGSMVPQFDEAVFALPVGQLSDPVKTQFGYHLIQTQAHTTKSFDDVRGEITDKMRPELAQKAVEDIKSKATITFDSTYFGK